MIRFKRKLKPYSKKRIFKFRLQPLNSAGVTKQEKLIIKNANRSLKKGKRQELKNELNNLLNENT